MKTRRITYGILFLILLAIEICIALFVRDRFVRPYVGDLLVTVLICCLCRIVIPSGAKLLPVYVFLFASAVELMQAADVVALLGLEENRLVSTLLGRTFSFADLVCYALGCVVFLGIRYWLEEKSDHGQDRT